MAFILNFLVNLRCGRLFEKAELKLKREISLNPIHPFREYENGK